MKYAKQFLISFIAGAGSAIGSFVGKECMTIAKSKYEKYDAEKKAKATKNTT